MGILNEILKFEIIKETVLLLVYPHYPLLPCQASFAEVP